MSKATHKFCDFLESTSIAKSCNDVKGNTAKIHNYQAILGLVGLYGPRFQQNVEEVIITWIEQFGFVKSHFSDEEWRMICAYAYWIFKFCQEKILNKINENK